MNWHRMVQAEYKRLCEERNVQISNVWNKNRSFIQDSTVMTSPCSWILDHNNPSQLSKGPTVAVKIYDKNSTKCKLQVIRKHMLSVVDLPPQNVAWLPIPRNMSTKALQRKTTALQQPYQGDESVDSGFIDELMDGISDNDANNNYKKYFMDDETFIKLVQALIPYQQDNITDETLSLNSQQNEITPVDVKDTAKSLAVPDAMIFQSISKVFRGKISADILSEKYTKLIKITTCRPNIDRPMEEALKRDEALTTYHKLFCRKCMMYNCLFHCHENSNFVPKLKTGDIVWLQPFERPCTNFCYLLKKERRENFSATKRKSLKAIRNDVAIDSQSEWCGSELTMLGALKMVFPNNFCVIAEIIRSKNCQQVHKQYMFTGLSPNVRSKKFKPNNRGWRTQNSDKVYEPCNHNGPCSDKDICSCINCEKWCNCDADCIYRTRMTCNCKSSCATHLCLCVTLFRECDPDACGCVTCKNVNIQQRVAKKLQVASSSIHGWGLYADEDCQKGDFIIEYRGELITIEEADRRGKWYDKQRTNYMFTLNEEYVVDAMSYGSKARFANFSRTPNCTAKVLRVNGDHRIGIYANRFIQTGEELTFNYYTYDPTSDE